MSPEEMKELIKSTITEVSLWNSLIIAIVPVIFTIATNLIYDSIKRKNEFIKQIKIQELKELYIPLYCMISQSEYIRFILGDLPNVSFSIEDAPYIHLEKKRNNIKIDKDGFHKETYKVDDELTKYDEKTMVNLVIDKSKYASPKLIKLAIAYRFIVENRDTTDITIKAKIEAQYNNIAINFIKEVVSRTNEKLKYCGSEFVDYELNINDKLDRTFIDFNY
jgi:hypothetical protein